MKTYEPSMEEQAKFLRAMKDPKCIHCGHEEKQETVYEYKPTTAAYWERQFARVNEDLEKLLFAVERKHPGETRMETALRYIREAEEDCKGGKAATPNA